MATTTRTIGVVKQKDVVDYYSFDGATAAAGTFVKVTAGNDDLGVNQYVTRNTANGGWASHDHSYSQYPSNPKKVAATAATDTGLALGFLLYDVRETDENGNKLLFDPAKAKLLQCVMSGQSVPVVTDGEVIFNKRAFANDVIPTVGQVLILATGGCVTGVSYAASTADVRAGIVGKVLATGTRTSGADTDAFAGGYALCKICIK